MTSDSLVSQSIAARLEQHVKAIESLMTGASTALSIFSGTHNVGDILIYSGGTFVVLPSTALLDGGPFSVLNVNMNTFTSASANINTLSAPIVTAVTASITTLNTTNLIVTSVPYFHAVATANVVAPGAGQIALDSNIFSSVTAVNGMVWPGDGTLTVPAGVYKVCCQIAFTPVLGTIAAGYASNSINSEILSAYAKNDVSASILNVSGTTTFTTSGVLFFSFIGGAGSVVGTATAPRQTIITVRRIVS